MRSTTQLKKQLWKLFSIYIRQRDKGICISCGKRDDWKKTHAGHFVHDCMDFNEMNINCQCARCNKWLHGNLANYAIRLKDKIGMQKVEWLLGQKGKLYKYSVGELKLLINHYKKQNGNFTSSSHDK